MVLHVVLIGRHFNGSILLTITLTVYALHSYVDSDGILQTVEYTADAQNGFRAAATNLPRAPVYNPIAPEPVRETPEVAQARADHMAAYNEAAARAAVDDTVETIAAPLAAPIAQIATPIATPIANAGFVAVRTADYPSAAFSYQFNSPAYAYATGNFYANAPYQYTFGSPLLRASPLEIRPAAVDIRPAAVEIRTVPLELQTPAETPEVAQARAEHLAAVEMEKARIAATN